MVSHMNPSDAHSKAVALRVARLLREAKITQQAAAAATGIHLTTLKRRLAGHTPLNVNEVAALADLLDLTIPELVNVERAA